MNSQQAKRIDLPNLLSRLGYEPVKITKAGREYWYRSPFRNERSASFHASYLGKKWIWNDFGDKGGNVIDFVMRHQNIGFRDALAFLRNLYQGSLFSFQKQPAAEAPLLEVERELEFLEATEISNPVILNYLEQQRRIPPALAQQYLKEVKYLNKTKDKVFFAFGIPNESAGFEIRSASDEYVFKSALIKRDITLIRGRGLVKDSVNVLEGMTDFLSLLCLMKCEQLPNDSIILHSLTSFQRSMTAIQENGYAHIYTYLDNNAAGQESSRRFTEAFPGQVIAWSERFLPHIDLNDALKAGALPFELPETLAEGEKNDIPIPAVSMD